MKHKTQAKGVYVSPLMGIGVCVYVCVGMCYCGVKCINAHWCSRSLFDPQQGKELPQLLYSDSYR